MNTLTLHGEVGIIMKQQPSLKAYMTDLRSLIVFLRCLLCRFPVWLVAVAAIECAHDPRLKCSVYNYCYEFLNVISF